MSVRMVCPYIFCSREFEANWMRAYSGRPNAQRLMVPDHSIQHSFLTGACPASLMWLPLGEHEVELLKERATNDRRTIEQAVERAAEGRQTHSEERPGDQFPLTSTRPSGVPLRLGREPSTEGPERNHWFPPRPPDEEEHHVAPPHVEGHVMGGRGMASVEEIVGQVTAANVMLGEAIGALAQAQQEMEAAAAQLAEAKNTFDNALGRAVEARDMVAHTVENSGSATLGDMLGSIQGAIDDHLTPGAGRLDEAPGAVHATMYDREEASGDLAAAMEKGETYIGLALS